MRIGGKQCASSSENDQHIVSQSDISRTICHVRACSCAQCSYDWIHLTTSYRIPHSSEDVLRLGSIVERASRCTESCEAFHPLWYIDNLCFAWPRQKGSRKYKYSPDDDAEWWQRCQQQRRPGKQKKKDWVLDVQDLLQRNFWLKTFSPRFHILIEIACTGTHPPAPTYTPWKYLCTNPYRARDRGTHCHSDSRIAENSQQFHLIFNLITGKSLVAVVAGVDAFT